VKGRYHPELDFATLAALTGIAMSVIARQAEVDYRCLQRWKANGFTVEAADRVAVACGFHPAEVWGWDVWLSVQGRPCENCGRRFTPARVTQRFCHRRCKSAAGMRRRYATDPDYRAKKVEAVARYYAECGEYVRTRQRRRYQAGAAA
jgi:hypothetical protein